MAEIDTSIYPKVQPPGSGLDMVDKIVGIRNALLQGQQQQQALQIGGQTLRSNELGISTQQYELAMKHYQGMSSFFSQLYARPNLTKADMIQAGADAVNMGLADPKQVATELSALPDDNAGIHDHIKQLIFSANDAATRLEAIAPKPQTFSVGGQTAVGTFPSMGGKPSIQGFIQNTVPPTTPQVQPDLSQRLTGGTQPTVSGDIQPPPQAPAQSPTGGAAAAPAPAAIAPGGIVSAPPPGAAEALTGAAGISIHQAQALQTAVDSIPTQRTQLANLSSLLGKFTGGPAADVIRHGKSLVNELTGANIFDPNDIAAQDAFTKQATQLAQQQFGQLGGTGTDAKLDSAMHTNPSQFLSNQSNREIIAMLNGNLDALQAKGRAWQAYQSVHGPQSYGSFQTQFNDHFDPRVFQMTHLPPKNRADMIDEMSPSERKSFLKNFKYAEQQGWVDRNNLQAGQ